MRPGTRPFLADAREVEALRRRIELAGTLEMRMLATNDYLTNDGRKLFDLSAEKERLQTWLIHGGRELVLQDPRTIDRFQGDPKAGPLAGKDLCWFVHEIRPKNAKRWTYSFALSGAYAGAVLVSDPVDFNSGMIPDRVLAKHADQQRLVELVAVNMNEQHFDNRDLDPDGIAMGFGPDGSPCLFYRLRNDRRADFADWSQRHIGHFCAILIDGRVVSAPRFESRIPGAGQIRGDFTVTEAKALAETLKVDPLPITPVLLRQEPVKKP